MDLSFNKINEIKQSNNLQFKGLKGALDTSNRPVFEFTPPPHNHNEEVTLEVAYLDVDKKTGLFNAPSEFIEFTMSDDRPFSLLQEKFDTTQTFGYRYRIVNKDTGNIRYASDESQAVDSADGKGKFNVVNQGTRINYGVSPKGGSMYHAFVDSNLVLKKDPDKQEVKTRNHFNKIGGTIKDILYLLKKTDTFKPYTYLMLNPDIGADRISSHKYWPENQYQCTNLDDFKELNVELFKQGKGYVADGAFTSQGLNSPLVQHVFKWGKQSPFYNMLKIDGDFCPGVLPDVSADDKEKVYSNLGIRIVNPKKDNKNYDSSKPTYIQFFDKRLLSEKKQNDIKNLYFDYDREPDDHYDIVKHQDSILPLAFEIDPDCPQAKAFGGKSKLMFNEIPNLDRFLTFDHSKIVSKKNSSGYTSWDGNVDLVKMNTSNPSIGTEEGCEAARNYLFGVATYWTETIQKSLLKETALMSEREKEKVAKNNDINSQKYEKILDDIKSGSFESRILSQAKTVEDYIYSFPLQSVETAPELSAVFSEPQFMEEFLNAKSGSVTVGEKLEQIVNDTIDSVIPKEYKDNSDYRTYVVKTYGSDIIKNALVSAMNPKAVKSNGSIDLDKLKEVNIKTFIDKPNNPSEERHAVIKGISEGLEKIDTASVQKTISKELSKISLDDFKLSESIVLQGKGGLNWRFDAAKDIGDLDAVRNKTADFKTIWQDILSFWGGFISNIREENPSSYIINEITELSEFYNWHDIDSIRRYGGDEAVEQFLRLTDDEKNDYKKNIAYKTEKAYLAQTGSTTTSMFDEGFNRFSKFVGVDPETGEKPSNEIGSLKYLMKTMRELQRYSQPNNSIFAHSFTQNHDKPALLHTLPLDMNLFLQENVAGAANPIYKAIAKDITGRDDYKNISAKAVAVGHMLKQGIKKYVDPQYHDALFKALSNLANGRRNDFDRPDFNRAEAFGTLPYELSLKDIIEDAGLKGKIDPIALQYEILYDAREQQMAMTRASNGMPGVYTLFNGAEFGQTGYETKNKNVHVDNRNRVMRELKDNPLFAPEVKEVEANLSLYKEQGMSALGGGFSKSLNIQKTTIEDEQNAPKPYNSKNFEKYKKMIADFIETTKSWPKGKMCTIEPELLFEAIDNAKKDNTSAALIQSCFKLPDNEIDSFLKEYEALKTYFTKADSVNLEMAPVYAYDEKGSRVLTILTNNGLPQVKNSENSGGSSVSFTVKTEKQAYDFSSVSLVDAETGVAPLEDGTILKRKVYDAEQGKFVDENCEYVVHNGELMKKSAVDKREEDFNDDDYITIDDTTASFYVPRDGQKYKYMASLYGGLKK